MKVVICDDDEQYVDLVQSYVNEYAKDNSINITIDSFNEGESLLNSAESYSMAFLDIEIGSVSGLDIAQHLKKINKYIIIFFITNYEKYIDDAMNLFALRFIEKPINKSRLFSGMEKALELINENVIEFYLKSGKAIVKIKENEIIYIETKDHKTKVVTADNTYYSKELIDEWQERLSYSGFYRIHKSFILNIDYINEYQRDEVSLTNGEKVPISYRKQSEFRKFFYDYLRRRR